MDIIVSQIGIFLFGAASMYLVARKDKYKRYGYILGLMGQPFWYYNSLMTENYGIFLLSLFYTYSWCLGVYNYWIKE